MHVETDSGFGYGCRKASFYKHDDEYRQSFLVAIEKAMPDKAQSLLDEYSATFPEFSRESPWFLSARLKYLPQAHLEILDRDVEEKVASSVAKKLNNPQGHPSMSLREAAHACNKSESTIRRWVQEGTLQRSQHGKQISTASVRQLLLPSA